MNPVNRQCRSCKHHRFDALEGKCVCLNAESDEYTAYTDGADACDKWEARRSIGFNASSVLDAFERMRR